MLMDSKKRINRYITEIRKTDSSNRRSLLMTCLNHAIIQHENIIENLIINEYRNPSDVQ